MQIKQLDSCQSESETENKKELAGLCDDNGNIHIQLYLKLAVTFDLPRLSFHLPVQKIKSYLVMRAIFHTRDQIHGLGQK